MFMLRAATDVESFTAKAAEAAASARPAPDVNTSKISSPSRGAGKRKPRSSSRANSEGKITTSKKAKGDPTQNNHRIPLVQSSSSAVLLQGSPLPVQSSSSSPLPVFQCSPLPGQSSYSSPLPVLLQGRYCQAITDAGLGHLKPMFPGLQVRENTGRGRRLRRAAAPEHWTRNRMDFGRISTHFVRTGVAHVQCSNFSPQLPRSKRLP
jgi:hypothetical protein